MVSAPETPAGLRLLAHELVHVEQQRQAGPPGSKADVERQAQRREACVASGGRMTETPIPSRGIDRQPQPGAAAPSAPAASDPVTEIAAILDDPLTFLQDPGKPYRILNGLSVAHMLATLSTLKSMHPSVALPQGGYFHQLYGNFEAFAAGVSRPRLKAVFEAVAQPRAVTMARFCLTYRRELATIEIEGIEAILGFRGGIPRLVKMGDHRKVGKRECAVCESDIRCDGSRSWRGNNPGNLTLGVSEFAYPGTWVPGGPAKIAIFPTDDIGFLALIHWVESLKQEGLSIRGWVGRQPGPNPSPQDDPDRFAADLASGLGTVPGASLASVSTVAFAQRVQTIEGWHPGDAFAWSNEAVPEEVLTLRAGLFYAEWKGLDFEASLLMP